MKNCHILLKWVKTHIKNLQLPSEGVMQILKMEHYKM